MTANRPDDSPPPSRSSADAPGLPVSDRERAAFLAWVTRLVHEHRVSLVRAARAEGLTPEDAFDAVQEAFQTFLTLPQARSLVDERDQSRKLLTVVARNVARNRRRLHAVKRPHVSDPAVVENLAAEADSVEDAIAAGEEHIRLYGCLRTLAETQRAVVTLRMLDETPGEDVARTLGISPGHVAVLLHRAKANLLSCLTASRAHFAAHG